MAWDMRLALRHSSFQWVIAAKARHNTIDYSISFDSSDATYQNPADSCIRYVSRAGQVTHA
jgi:hypothetical protein